MDRAIPGIVTSIDGRVSRVRTGRGDTLACRLAARVKGAGRGPRLAVGDRVEVAPAGPGEGVIESVAPRATRLARGRRGRQERGRGPGGRTGGAGRKRGDGEQVIAANVDQIAIVASAREPDWRPGFIDRVLCAAEKGGIEPLIVASKMDLLGAGSEGPAAAGPSGLEARVRHDLAVYRGLGHRAIETSVRAGAGLDDLGAALRGRVTVLAGQSGAGKSSLLNAIEPGLRLATREVSRATGKGRHTTSGASLLPLPGGGFVLDTPGVRSFAFYDLEPREVGRSFREIARIADSCRFRDCLHLDEPECAVRYAFESGVIDARRFESYRRILASLAEEEEQEPGR